MAPGGASAATQALLTAALAQIGVSSSAAAAPLLELDLMVSTYATSVQMRGVAVPTGISIGLNRGAPFTIDASTAFGGVLSTYLPLLTRIGTQQQKDGANLLGAARLQSASAAASPLSITGALLNFAAFGTSASYSSWAGAIQPFSLKFAVPIPPALVASLPPSVSFDSLMVNVVAAAGSGSSAAVTYAVSLGAGCSVVLPSFAFSAAANGGTAAASGDDEGSRGVLRVEATATWSSVTQRLSVSAALNANGGATLYPFRARWIGVSQISLRFDASTAPDVVARLPTSNLAFGMLVTVTTGQGASVAISMAASFRAAEPSSASSGGPPVFLLRADNVPLASLVPALASSVTGFVTVIVSNVHAAVPNATSSTSTMASATGGGSAFNCVPGLNFFATDFNLQPGAFQGALATLNARGTSRMAVSSPSSLVSTVFPGNVPFDVPVAANSSLTGVFSPADGAVSIAYTNAYVPIGGGSSALSLSLRQVSIAARVALNPAPGSYSFALDAQLVAAVPNLPPIEVTVSGRFRADAAAAGLTVSGALPAWPRLFGLPWLALGATRVTARFASSSATAATTRVLSVTSTATVSSTALSMTVPLCGVLSCVSLLLLSLTFALARFFVFNLFASLILTLFFLLVSLSLHFLHISVCALRRHR
jgi:hypothetical protein